MGSRVRVTQAAPHFVTYVSDRSHTSSLLNFSTAADAVRELEGPALPLPACRHPLPASGERKRRPRRRRSLCNVDDWRKTSMKAVFSPFTGRRWRQPDEGRHPASKSDTPFDAQKVSPDSVRLRRAPSYDRSLFPSGSKGGRASSTASCGRPRIATVTASPGLAEPALM